MIDNIYMDFQKAFDTVPHNRLLHKLKGYGILPILPWIEDFLTNRKHRVNVHGDTSVSNEIFMFADDTKSFATINEVTDSESLQQDLDFMERWSNKWLLLFHPEKCKVMRLNPFKSLPQYEYKLDKTPLSYVQEETD